MKLELDELTTTLAKKAPDKGIKAISPEKPFLEGFAENVGQVMNVLDSIGIKDLFIEKAREELQSRLFGGHIKNQITNSKNEVQTMIKPKIDIEKIISLALIWLDKFIEQNGDMPLSQFRKEIENQKDEIIKIIKNLGIG